MKTVIAGALGECVHVAGETNFLRLAEQAGWRTVFLGPAVSIDEFIETAHREKASLVGVSYRLTPETGERLLGEFCEAADMTPDDNIQKRVAGISKEAPYTLEAIQEMAPTGVADPLVDAPTLTRAVKTGILDAPQLKNNPYGRGQIVTRITRSGACIAIVPTTGSPLSESERIATLMNPS